MNNDWVIQQAEDRRKTDQRMTVVERLCAEHATDLRLITAEQQHMKELSQANFTAVEASQAAISSQVGAVNVIVSGLTRALDEFHGGINVIKFFGVAAVVMSFIALFKALIH